MPVGKLRRFDVMLKDELKEEKVKNADEKHRMPTLNYIAETSVEALCIIDGFVDRHL
jgi:hypothetical protein